LDQVAREADRLLGGSESSCLLIDETSFQKKGENSVGVERQWSGRLGKVENCQVAVFAALSQGDSSTLIDTRLYLPMKWIQEPERCLEAGVPESEIVLRSKADLAFEMVVAARQNGVRFHWVGVDGGYGKEPAFLRRLEDHGEVFVADVHKDQQIYPEDPAPCVPEKKGRRGKKPTLPQAQSASQRVDAWAAAQRPELWQKVAVRPGTKGEVRVEADGSLLACSGHPGDQLSEDDQVRPEQCSCGDFSAAACADAEAAVLDRAFVRGCQERERPGRLSGARLAGLAPPRGFGDDGDAVHAGGEAPS